MSGFDKYLLQARLWRRHLHQNPELAHHEVQTSAFIIAEMSKLEHAEVTQLTPTSVLVAFRTGTTGAKIGLRAEIDAFPIQEERPDLVFASQNAGIMHARGHDGHAAVLMAICSYISENFNEFTGEIYAIFQHAEESNGAAELVATRFFDDFDFIYSQRLISNLPTGFVDIKNNICSMNIDSFSAKIQSKESQNDVDPIFTGAQFVTLLHKITAQRTSPHDDGFMMVENNLFKSEGIANNAPSYADLSGTVKTTTEEARSLAALRLENMLREVCTTTNAIYHFSYERGYSAVLNHPVKTEIVTKLAQNSFGDKVITLPFLLDGEGFSEFSQLVPSTLVLIGTANSENSALPRQAKFGLDEDSLIIAFTLMLNIAHNSHIFK